MESVQGSQVRTILVEELEGLRKRIAANILNTGQSASGRTAKSLRVEATNDTGILYGRGAFGTLETGRKGGKVPQGFYQVIKQWAYDKRLVFENERERNTFAYFVARKIAREGTKLFRSGGRSDVYSSEIPQTINNIRQRIAKVVAGGITIDEQIKLNK